jgi:flagellar FliL protein
MSMSTMTSPPAADAGPEAGTKKGGRRKKLLVILLAVLLVAAAAWFLVVSPRMGDHAPVPGEVVPLEPVQINLADSHYLRVAIALQFVEGAGEADGSKALDALIELFSGRPQKELTRPAGRLKLKEELERTLEKRYEGEVMGVYFTEFVTQ